VNVKTFSILGSTLIFLMVAPAHGQQMRPAENSSMPAPQGLYSVVTFGVFQKMMMQGDFTPKVRLDAAIAGHPSTGVGAVADARGEITIYDGKLIVSYGGSRAGAVRVGGPRRYRYSWRRAHSCALDFIGWDIHGAP
jgi:hypothetical protein